MKNFQSFITEENVNDGDIQIAVLTKTSSNKEEVVANQLKKYSDKNKIPCHIVNTREAWVSDNDLEKGTLTIYGPILNKQMRIGEHSDYGTITLLWQINDVPGLQVQDLEGTWWSVPYAEDGVVCNIGDLLQRWTNDYFKSTKHRVVNSHIHKQRYSMPHFVDPTPGTIVENLRKGEEAKYDPIESKEYLMWRLAQSY